MADEHDDEPMSDDEASIHSHTEAYRQAFHLPPVIEFPPDVTIPPPLTMHVVEAIDEIRSTLLRIEDLHHGIKNLLEQHENGTQTMVGDRLPAVMSREDMIKALGVTAPTFAWFQQTGKLRRFEFKKPVSKRLRYSGARVMAYLSGEESGTVSK